MTFLNKINMYKSLKFSIGLILFFGLMLSSCKNEESILTIIGEDSATLKAISDLKLEYENETGTKVKIVALPFEEAMEKSNLDLSQSTGLYDIILQYNFSLSPFVRNNYVYDLDDLTRGIEKEKLNFENDLFEEGWQEVGYYYKDFQKPELGNKKVGYPFASNTMLLVYNKEWFENEEYKKDFKEKYNRELSVPETWEEIKEVSEFFTVPDDNRYGIAIEGAEGGWLYYQWVNMFYGMGGKVMDKNRGWKGNENTTVNLNSKHSLSTMKMMLSLKPFNKGNFFDVDAYNLKESMKEGNVALSVMWSDLLYDLIDLDNPELNKFGFAPVPGKKSMIAGGAFFVNKNSNYSEEAMDFIAWLMQKDNQLKMLKKGLCSPRKSVYDDPSVQDIPYLDALKTSLDRGVYMVEAGPDADVISQNITKYAQKVWRGELTPKDAVNQMQIEILQERNKVFEAFK
jgi:multiple sugar transport system substrate-binding protein